MRNNKEVFYLKVDTDFGVNGLVLINRQNYHNATTGQGILHDLFEHPYKPIKNPYLDEIAALGAYNEYRVNEDNDITDALESFLYDCWEQDSFRFKWSIKYLNSKNEEVFETIKTRNLNKDNKEYFNFLDRYKYLFSYYFNLGADIFNTRFSNYFNDYYDLYNDVGSIVLDKLKPLINSKLERIKLIIDYKEREVKIEY